MWLNLFQHTDILDNNSPYLQEIASLIANKNECKDKFTGVNLKKLIDNYMVCVTGTGNLDGEGVMLSIGSTSNSGCGRRSENSSAVRIFSTKASARKDGVQRSRRLFLLGSRSII